MQTVNVSSLVPNPFRELDDYPIDREKVDALKESIEATGFWGTIVARKKGSKYEIAFGHHRMIAMQELGLKKCEVIVRDLSNEDMVQMMARENFEEWDTDAYIESQTVESTIRAYGRGEIQLPPVPKDTRKDLIRNVDLGLDPRPYTQLGVAVFLGMTKKKGDGLAPNQACTVAFQIIDAIDQGIVTRKQLMKVNRDVAREIITKAMAIKREQERIARDREKEAQRAAELAEQETDSKKRRAFKSIEAKKRHEAKVAAESAEKVAKGFASDAVKQTKSGNWSQRDVREAAAEEKARLRSKAEQRYKEAKDHYDALSRRISKMLNETVDAEFSSLVQLLGMDCGLEPHHISVLIEEVEALKNRAEKFSRKLRAWKPPKRADSVGDQLRIVG